MDVITYPCTDINQTISVNEPRLAINIIMLVMNIFWRARHWMRYAGTRKQSSSWVGWLSILAHCNQCARRKWVLPMTTIMHAKNYMLMRFGGVTCLTGFRFQIVGHAKHKRFTCHLQKLGKVTEQYAEVGVTSSESIPINGSISNFFHLILDAD